MSISIKILSGKWVARTKSGTWVVFNREPSLDEKHGCWVGGDGLAINYHRSLFDLTGLPTYHEPDWRKTKFQVQ